MIYNTVKSLKTFKMTKQDWSYRVEMSLNGKVLRSKKRNADAVHWLAFPKKYQTNAAGKHLLKLVLFSSINLQGNIWSFIEETPIWEGVCGRRLFGKKRNCANPSLGGLSKKAAPIWEGVCRRRLFHNFGNAVFAQNELFQHVHKVRLSRISTRSSIAKFAFSPGS